MAVAESPDQVAFDLRRMAASTGEAVLKATLREGLSLQRDVKRRAARSRTLPSVPGLPPRLQTGDYNRSIGMRATRAGGTAVASIGTNAVQGRALEFGGRHTWPHPHFGPSFERSKKRLLAAVDALLAMAARS
jgi:hypothetical protein